MTIVLSDLRTELREHLGGLDSSDLDNDACDLLLNRAFWEIMNKIPFRETEQSATFTTTAGTAFYSTPSLFEAIRKLSIKDLDYESWEPLDRITIDTHEEELNTDSDARGKPTGYVREDGGYRLQPIPDDAYDMRIKYWVTLADLSDSNTTPSLPTVWHEIILFGAVFRGFRRFGDHIRAREFRNDQIGMINTTVPVESKEEIDSPRAGVSIPEELTTI